jgi:hypothetical protein
VREGGRLFTGELKLLPNCRCVREGGRESTVWLKNEWKLDLGLPKKRCVRDDGRESTDSLNNSPKVRYLSEEGRLFTGWLKYVPNVR